MLLLADAYRHEEPVAICDETAKLLRSRSQSATLKRGQNIKHLPYAFTEHGAIMAANVLNSPQATQMSVFVVGAFVKMRAVLSDNRQLARKLAELEKELKARLDLRDKVPVADSSHSCWLT